MNVKTFSQQIVVHHAVEYRYTACLIDQSQCEYIVTERCNNDLYVDWPFCVIHFTERMEGRLLWNFQEESQSMC